MKMKAVRRKEKVDGNGHLPPLKMTKTISKQEITELKSRYQVMLQTNQVYRASVAFYKGWERVIQEKNQLPQEFSINLDTGIVSWEQPQKKGGLHG